MPESAPDRTPPDDTTREVVATDVGRRIRSLRERLSISQDTLALRLGCTQTAVSYWESGKRLIGLDDLLRVSGALGVTSSALLPDDTAAPVPADGPVLCLCGNPDNCSCPPDGLRTRLTATVTRWALMYPLGNYGIWGTAGASRDQLAGIAEDIAAAWGRDIADRVLTELAGDPGDLPARMAEALYGAFLSMTGSSTTNCNTITFEHLARVALSVRWEDHARAQAELGRLRNRITALEANGSELLARAEQAEAELTEIRRVTDSPADEEMPTDPAELREMWDFINRQSRWQHHMAQTFFRGRHRALRRAKAAEIEREALAAELALHVGCRVDISIGDALRLIRGEESNADAPTPVTAATEAHGETTEAQEARE